MLLLLSVAMSLFGKPNEKLPSCRLNEESEKKLCVDGVAMCFRFADVGDIVGVDVIVAGSSV